MNIPVVIDALEELAYWLCESKLNQKKVRELITALKRPDITEGELQKIKYELSKEMLFHPKWLGDVYVSGFPEDGTGWAWLNYLTQVEQLCQLNL